MLIDAFIREQLATLEVNVSGILFPPFPKKTNKQTDKMSDHKLTVIKLSESEFGSCNLMTVPTCVCGDSIYLFTWYISNSLEKWRDNSEWWSLTLVSSAKVLHGSVQLQNKLPSLGFTLWLHCDCRAMKNLIWRLSLSIG